MKRKCDPVKYDPVHHNPDREMNELRKEILKKENKKFTEWRICPVLGKPCMREKCLAWFGKGTWTAGDKGDYCELLGCSLKYERRRRNDTNV